MAEQRRSIHDEGAAIEVFGALPLFAIQPTTTASVAVPHTLLAHPADRQRTLAFSARPLCPNWGPIDSHPHGRSAPLRAT